MRFEDVEKVRKSDLLLVAIKQAIMQDMEDDPDYYDNADGKLSCILKIGNVIDPKDLDWEIGFIFKHLCISTKRKGYVYLRDAIKMYVLSQDEMQMDYVTKSIYPDIGKAYGVSPSSIERDIRYAVSDIKNASYIRKMVYFGASKDSYSNKEVIISIADYIKFGGGMKAIPIKEINIDVSDIHEDDEDQIQDQLCISV